jgi:P27 family predicted phage terminase small subunit
MANRGRPPKPTFLRVLEGNRGKRPINKHEPQPTIPAEPPEPPSFLMPAAKDEWHRIAGDLHRIGLLTVVDTMPLAAYCQSVARWQQAEALLGAMAERDPVTGALLIRTSAGSPMQNPLLRVAVGAADAMLRYATEFGLSPAARARVAGGLVAQVAPGKFDGLLGGH